MPMLPWFDQEQITFPPLESALEHPNGLLAAGGNLASNTLLEAYRRGIFPWFSEGDPILWWSPDPRLILRPSHIKISSSLRKTLKKSPFDLSMDTAFIQVMQHCAAPRNDTNETWITSPMIDAYAELHRLGHAHSIECWHEGILVGGLYGISIGRVFFGESMFTKQSNASKVALVHLCGQLDSWGYQLIDCQTESPHLKSLGAQSISREKFGEILFQNAKPSTCAIQPSRVGRWSLEWQFPGN